jgi:pyruvate formate lyase activating enzyme
MEAYLYEPLKEKKVKCNLCSHRCIIKDGKRGICGVRENQGGILKTLVYGKLIASHIDPIEKKPLFHFMPGSPSYSIATVGCNFKCLFCQNADISQMPSDHNGMITGDLYTPEDVVDAAIKGNCKSIAYTYTEPTIFFEFAFDTAKLAHAKGIKNVFVTNGYMTSEAVHMISPYLDAANVDLKAFNESFYKEIVKARLEPVKKTLRVMKSLGIFVEVTTLLIPGLNDDKKELEKLALFLVKSLGPETPWHVSAFYPTYRLTDRPPTPVESLVMAREIGIKAGINRLGFSIIKNVLENGRCPYCGAQIHGIWLENL